MLQDLDELALQCRDERAKAYIREAVLCFKAGAYRSAIVSTWIAVAFDIVDKIHELSLAGDKEAQRFVGEYEAHLASNNTDKLLKIERELLSTARDKFELISAQEHLDLERLREDRHRCAHPSRPSVTEVFSPSAELARVHIRSAVDCLLRHEPSQGKAALEGLLRLTSSPYFPKDRNKALTLLEGSPLRRGRPSLVRNLLLLMLKAYLDPSLPYDQRQRTQAVMLCIKRMHPGVWENTLRADLTRIVRTLDGNELLYRVVRLLVVDGDFADALENDQITRLQEFILSRPTGLMDVCEDALSVPSLAEAATRAISTMRVADVAEIAFASISDEVRARVIRAYCTAISFDSANAWGKLIPEFSGAFTADDVRTILTAAASNDQIKGSFQVRKVIADLERHSLLGASEFDALVARIGLT